MPPFYDGGCSYRHCIYMFLKYESGDHALMAKSSNRYASVPYYAANCRSVLYKKKDLPITVLPTGMTHSIWSFCVFEQNVGMWIILLSDAKWPSSH